MYVATVGSTVVSGGMYSGTDMGDRQRERGDGGETDRGRRAREETGVGDDMTKERGRTAERERDDDEVREESEGQGPAEEGTVRGQRGGRGLVYVKG
jgi:hypothetical protein